MLRILWNSESAMMAQQEKLDSISNNIANVNTEGYKRTDVNFSDLVYETLQRKGYPVSSGLSKEPLTGSGVKAGQWTRDNSQGNLVSTNSNTDMCIDGEGYFAVQRADGTTAYTRSGNFDINSDGSLVDKNGNKLVVLDNNGNNINSPETGASIMFKKDNFVVKSDGTLMVKDSNNNFTEMGKINTYEAEGQDSLISVGDSLYKPVNGAKMNVSNNTNIMQGYLEGSNVDVAKEMTDMMITQRAFELGSRGLKTADDMWSMVNNIRGR
jgi:flagellar basal-body rod protein FlgG